MSNGETDYSHYMKHRSNLTNIFALLSGFTFTSTTISISRLPDPSSFSSQVTLLFSSVMHDLFVFLLMLNTVNIFNYIRNIPPPTKTTNFISVMSVVSVGLWGFLPPLIFLLWNLTILAFTSTLIWAFFIASGIVLIWRPFEQRRRQLPTHSETGTWGIVERLDRSPR